MASVRARSAAPMTLMPFTPLLLRQNGFIREKKAHKHKLFALFNVQMALGQTAGCPRVSRAKKFMCSPRNTGNTNFFLWLSGGLSQGCPDFQKVYVYKVSVSFSCPKILELEAFCYSEKFFQQISQDFPGVFLGNPRTDPGNSHSLLEFSEILCRRQHRTTDVCGRQTTRRLTRRKYLFFWVRRRTHKLYLGSTGPSPEQKVYVYAPFSLPMDGQIASDSKSNSLAI